VKTRKIQFYIPQTVTISAADMRKIVAEHNQTWSVAHRADEICDTDVVGAICRLGLRIPIPGDAILSCDLANHKMEVVA
jgi:hypothetical protein